MKTVLIDAGMSLRGHSHYAPPNQCLFGRRLAQEFEQKSSPPLLIGSLGHVVQAHHHAKIGLKVNGQVTVNGKVHTEDVFLDPMDALDAFCSIYPEHEPYRNLVTDTYVKYTLKPPRMSTPYEVETELAGVVGKKNGEFGYWMVRDDVWGELTAEVKKLPANDGKIIEVTPLGIKGHPDSNKPVFLTRRLDLVCRDGRGVVDVIDHKHKQNIYGKPASYIADMGFVAIWALSMQRWGAKLGNVEIHGICVNDKQKGKTKITRLPYPKIRLKGLAHYLLRTARNVARLEKDEMNGHIDMFGWPMSGSLEVGGGCTSIYKDKNGWTCPFAYFCAGEQELVPKKKS